MSHRMIVVSDFIAIRVSVARIGSTIDLESVDLTRGEKVRAHAPPGKVRL
jgi:hypothetical protein